MFILRLKYILHPRLCVSGEFCILTFKMCPIYRSKLIECSSRSLHRRVKEVIHFCLKSKHNWSCVSLTNLNSQIEKGKINFRGCKISNKLRLTTSTMTSNCWFLTDSADNDVYGAKGVSNYCKYPTQPLLAYNIWCKCYFFVWIF